MGPMAEFRHWLHSASPVQLVTTGTAAALVVAVLAWLTIPSSGDERGTFADATGNGSITTTNDAPSDTAAEIAGAPQRQQSGAAGEQTAPASRPDAADAGGAGGAGGAGTGTAGSTTAGCQSPPGSAPGVSASEIKIAIGNTEVVGPAANGVFGIPPAEYLRAEYEAVIDAINRNGGIACRKVVADFYKINPADRASMQGQCLDIVESGVFAVLDDGGWGSVSPNTVTCFAQNRLPYFGAYFLTADQVQREYPYVFAFYAFETLYRNTAFALNDLGFFDPSKGFAKLGFLYRDCYPKAIDAFRRALDDVGLDDNAIVRYSLGCPSAFASPADLQQAVLTFQRSGVTHVTTGYALGDFANFTKIAEQQRFRPKYGLPDETLIPISYGSMRAEPRNIAGAIAITVSRNGEEHTPGFVPSAGTARCDEIMKSHGLRSTYEEPTGAGNACSLLWILQAAVQHAPSLERSSLAQGLNRARSVEVSYPQAPNDFSGSRVMTGGQFWRAAQYVLECECWRVTGPDFRPSFR